MRTVLELEEIVRKQEEDLKVCKRLIESHQRQHEIQEQLQAASDKVAVLREGQVQTKDALIEAFRSKSEAQDGQIEALKQAALHNQVLFESAEHYAIQAKAILIYTLERVPRGDDWPRLWEALPRKQKIEYFLDAAAWLNKQPTECDPELRKKLKDPPMREKPDERTGAPQ